MPIPYTWVYVIHDPYTDLYKIGQSDDPVTRLKELNKKPLTILPTPNDFELYQAWLCPARKEREFHVRFAEFRKRGEWFALDADDLREIHYDLYEYRRFTASNHTPLIVEHLCRRVDDLTSSTRFYAEFVSLAGRMAGRDSGSPFFVDKQLTTSLSGEKWFDEYV